MSVAAWNATMGIMGNGTLVPAMPSFEPYATISEVVELAYQVAFASIGTPLNIYVALKQYRMFAWCRYKPTRRMLHLSQHLTVANLLVTSVYCVWRSIWFVNVVWLGGDISCKIYSFISVFGFHLWSNVIVAIAIEKVIAIRSPLGNHQRSQRSTYGLLSLAWLLAVLCSLPNMLFRGTVPIPNTPYVQCLFTASADLALPYQVFHIVSVFHVPLCIILGCYCWIGIMMFHKRIEMDKLNQTNKLSTNNANKKSPSADLPVLDRLERLTGAGLPRANSDTATAQRNQLLRPDTSRPNSLSPTMMMPGQLPAHSVSCLSIKSALSGVQNNSKSVIGSFRSRAVSTVSSQYPVGCVGVCGMQQPIPKEEKTQAQLIDQISAVVRWPFYILRSQARILTLHRISGRFIRTAAGIVGTYMLCWLPYQLLAIVPFFCRHDNLECHQLTHKWRWLEALLIGGACINPLLYQFGHESKRRRKRSTIAQLKYSTCGAENSRMSRKSTFDEPDKQHHRNSAISASVVSANRLKPQTSIPSSKGTTTGRGHRRAVVTTSTSSYEPTTCTTITTNKQSLDGQSVFDFRRVSSMTVEDQQNAVGLGVRRTTSTRTNSIKSRSSAVSVAAGWSGPDQRTSSPVRTGKPVYTGTTHLAPTRIVYNHGLATIESDYAVL